LSNASASVGGVVVVAGRKERDSRRRRVKKRTSNDWGNKQGIVALTLRMGCRILRMLIILVRRHGRYLKMVLL